MTKSTGTLAALTAALLLPLSAFAADPVAPPANTAAKPAPTETETKTATETRTKDAEAKKAEAKCEQSTSSRIRKSKEDCGKDASPTRSYSKDEIESTGQTDTGEALRRLDPRVQ